MYRLCERYVAKDHCCERTAHRHYATRQEARDDVIDYIEMFYNSERKHSYLGYVSPNEFEKLAKVA